LQALLDRSDSTGSEPERQLDAIYATVLRASVSEMYSEEKQQGAYDYLRLMLDSIVLLFLHTFDRRFEQVTAAAKQRDIGNYRRAAFDLGRP
jgi:hypothetical protein